ncbi:MAG: hypothetical protein ACE5Q6_21010, partial [Dehalococcoidia bacterium]
DGGGTGASTPEDGKMIPSLEVLAPSAAVVAILIFLVQFLVRFIQKQQQVIQDHIMASTEAQKALRLLGQEQVKATQEQTAVFRELLGYLKGQTSVR